MSDGWRVQPAHWLPIGIVAILVAAAVAVVVRRGDADPVVAPPSTWSATPTVSATPRPDCAPQITASWGDGKLFAYGFVYRSRCDQVVRKLRFRVAAVNRAGDELTTKDAVAFGGVLFPGAELAAAGDLPVPNGAEVSGLKVQVIDFTVQPPAEFSGWVRPEVVDPVRGTPDRRGGFTVTGTVRPPTPACVSEFVLIMRDKADRIIYAGQDLTNGQDLRPEFTVVPLPGLDFARTKIYASQVAHPCAGAHS
jgi:hypothetical protein